MNAVRSVRVAALSFLAACSTASPVARPRTVDEVRAAAQPPGWELVQARARPLVPPGAPAATAELEGAHAIAARHAAAWAERRRAHAASGSTAAAPLGEFPDAEPAIATLIRWADAGGSVPRLGPELDTMPALSLAQVAIVTADGARRAALVAAATYGARLLTEGATLIEGMIGVAILRAAIQRATALGDRLPATLVPSEDVIGRLLAAEADWAVAALADSLDADGLAAARAKGERPTEASVTSALTSLRARNEHWLTALRCAPPGTTGAALTACFAAGQGADEQRDPRPAMPAYIAKLTTLLDELRAHVAVP